MFVISNCTMTTTNCACASNHLISNIGNKSESCVFDQWKYF